MARHDVRFPEVEPGRSAWAWLSLSPALLLLGIFTLVPIATLIALSFSDLDWRNGAASLHFAGLAHYLELLHDEVFRAGAFNTLVFAIVAVSVEILLGFLAALLSSHIARGRIVYRTVFVLPILVPAIVIGAIWKLMYSFDFGIINVVTGALGVPPQDWLGDQKLALLSVIAVDVWHWTPFCYLLLLAGLEALPEDVYEAARIDGVRWWSELRFITVPMMLPVILVTFVFRLISAVKVFDEVFLLTGGGPGTATEVTSFTIYRRFFAEDRVGYGSAMSVVLLLVVGLVIVVTAVAGSRRVRA